MYSLNQVKTLVSCGRDPARSLPIRRGFLLIPLILVCLAVAPQMRAISPAPDGCYSNFNTAEGCFALDLITGGVGNVGLGWGSLLETTTGNFNTGAGAGTLLFNTTGGSNTAVGAVALLENTTGTENTAVGVDAMVFNTTGNFNDAVGGFALENNTDGFSNNAFGDHALFLNILGAENTAVGDLALTNNDSSGSALANFNTAVGAEALTSNTDGGSNNAVGAAFMTGALGSNTVGNENNAMGVDALGSNTDGAANTAMGDTAFFDNVDGSFNTVIGWDAGGGVEGNDDIYIGATSGLPGGGSEDGMIRIGDPTAINACFVAGISGVIVTGNPVCVTPDGQLGECGSAASPRSTKPLRLPKDWIKQRHAMQELKATTEQQAEKIASQEHQIQTLTAALKQQAEQIQKVSAQLEMIRPTPRVVNNQ
jgi:hypothetical protein